MSRGNGILFSLVDIPASASTGICYGAVAQVVLRDPELTRRRATDQAENRRQECSWLIGAFLYDMWATVLLYSTVRVYAAKRAAEPEHRHYTPSARRLTSRNAVVTQDACLPGRKSSHKSSPRSWGSW
eukprot:scaffold830_cov377-Prasinococcus_capsulatus_cf.AAC.8